MKFKIGDKIRVKDECKDVIVKNTLFMKEIIEKYDTFTVAEEVLLHDSFFKIKEDEGKLFWIDEWFEKAEDKPTTVYDEIHLSYIGDTTIAIHEKVGMATRSKHDKEDRKIGILIATMRAIGFNKESVDKVVDVLFDDIKDIKDYATEELLKEIMNRVK